MLGKLRQFGIGHFDTGEERDVPDGGVVQRHAVSVSGLNGKAADGARKAPESAGFEETRGR
ncbi:hypothetical protein GCM10009099_19430 [Caenispirillum bisanense]